MVRPPAADRPSEPLGGQALKPDELALRYAELRETRGTLRSSDPAAITGERCAHCLAAWRKGGQRGAQPRGWKTIVKLRRPRTLSDGTVLDEVEEKCVCGDCLADAAVRLGLDRAARDVAEWSGLLDRRHGGGIAQAARAGAAEGRLAKETDEWLRLSPIMECVPPAHDAIWWAQGIESLILFQHERKGSFGLVLESGMEQFPTLAPWTLERVERGIDLARTWIAWRYWHRHWRTKEDRMTTGGLVSVVEAARRLSLSERRVRNMVAGYRDDEGVWHSPVLEGVNVAAPDARRATWMVSVQAIDQELARRERETKRLLQSRSASEDADAAKPA